MNTNNATSTMVDEEDEAQTIFSSFERVIPDVDPDKPMMGITGPGTTQTKGGTDTQYDTIDF